MIDPDGIIVQETNLSNTIKIVFEEIEPYYGEIYCLEDTKEYEKYVKDIESQVRRSFEYKEMIKYLREYMGMDQCAFLKDVSNEENFGVRIEIHHYPFTLRDISDIVIRKRQYYGENLSVQMVSKEVMMLHYKLMVGLISLSQTVHELAHSSRLFIPSDKVLGRYNLFIVYYKPFCEPEQLEVINRIEKYTEEKQNTILNTNIIEQNYVHYEVNDTSFMLPDSSNINTAMLEQMNRIKENNYMLPSVNDVKMIETTKTEEEVIIDSNFKEIKSERVVEQAVFFTDDWKNGYYDDTHKSL